MYKFSFALLGVSLLNLNAMNIKEVVELTINNNSDISSKSINNKAFKKYVDEEEGGYYPKVDLTAEFGAEKEKINYKDQGSDDTKTNSTGITYQLDLDQVIFDPTLSSKIQDAEARYKSNSYKNSEETENIVYNSVKSYLDVLKYDERTNNSSEVIKVYEDYLIIANETEQISGEVLNKIQTNAKIRNSKNSFLQDTLSKKSAKISFKKNVGVSLKSDFCKPKLDESKIPPSLKLLIESSLITNYSVLTQIEKIKQQKAILEQTDGLFLPNIDFQLQGIYSDDLLYDEAKNTKYSAKIQLSYNIFNGGKDTSAYERDELFVKEAQKTLDVITNDVIETATIAYETYQISKEQVDTLKAYINDKKDVLSVYKDQFEGGTRSFIDVLNIESDIFNAKTNLINAEYDMIDAYYKILKVKSSLQTTILSSNEQCQNVSNSVEVNKGANKLINGSKDLNEIAASLKVSQVKVEENISNNSQNVNKTESSSITSNFKIEDDISKDSYYILYIASYKNKETTKKTLDLINQKLNNSYTSEIISNDNGTFTATLTNITSIDDVLVARTKLNDKFPDLYYLKKSIN